MVDSIHIIIDNKTYSKYTDFFDRIRPRLKWINPKMPRHEYHQNMFTLLILEKTKESNPSLKNWGYILLSSNHLKNNWDALLYNKENLTEFISIQYKFSNCFNHLDIINLNKRYNGGTDFLILDQPTNCWDVCKKEKCLLDVEKVIFCKSEIQKNINDQNIITNINNYNVTLEDFSVLYKNFINYGDEVGITSEIR